MTLCYALLFSAALVAAPAATLANPTQRTCGTPPPTAAQMQTAESIRARLALGTQSFTSGGTIGVAIHVLRDISTGNVPQEQIDAQMQVLNQDYGPCGYQFVLLRVDRTTNSAWHQVEYGTATEDAIVNALAIDPTHTINVYLANVSNAGGLLGWSYYPGMFAESDPHNAVFIDYHTLPGGTLSPYNLGKTLTHEVGHYLGIFHTFEGGCSGFGDMVDDTPAEDLPAFGCPSGRNTCPSPGDDPIHNYMDYTDDACMLEFTTGQCEFSVFQLAAGRPNLVVGGPTPVRVATWGAVKQHYR